MPAQIHPLETFFHNAVRSSYEERLGLEPELTNYVTGLLCEFSEPDNVYKLRDSLGQPIDKLEEMVRAADPIHGTAPSFIAERNTRKYIGDYALFLAGMCPEAIELDVRDQSSRPTLAELIRIGKESYYIVSQFNVFEFEHEAPLYERMSAIFEHCVLGLALVRRELWRSQSTTAAAR